MKQAVAVLALAMTALAGCISAPVPQELVDVRSGMLAEPVKFDEILRLSNAGIASDVIVEQIRSRGISDRPRLENLVALQRAGVAQAVVLPLVASPPTPPQNRSEPSIVYRDLFIPLWPSFSRGRWHLGLRISCYYRTSEEAPAGIPAQEPASPRPLPTIIEP